MSEDGSSRRDFFKAMALTGGIGMVDGIGSLPASAQEGTAVLPDRVPRKLLGTTGEEIPILVLGCAQTFDSKYDKILHRSFKSGVDYLDTAIVYEDGRSHKTIAPFIGQVGRDKLWITSKGPSRVGPKKTNADVASFTNHLDQCLEELQTDHLDLYFMHFIDDPVFLDPEYLQMGEKLRSSKKTRFFGFSSHGDSMIECMQKAAKVGGIDAIMFRYSFSRYGDLELNKAIDACKAAGIGLIAMKTQDSVPDDLASVKTFQSKDWSLAQAKLKAVWADERIDSVISHMDNTKKLAENVDAARSPKQLTMAEFQQLQRIATASAAYACQGCSHICESQFEGPVKVAAPLRHLMYHQCYDQPQRARRLYAALPSEEKAFDTVCFDGASAVCPQGIDIAARLAEVQRVLEV